MNISPSQLGREIFERYVTAPNLLQLAACGSHMQNPYHNLEHELAVAYYAFTAYVNEPEADETTLRHYSEVEDLLMAALFHDHGHSGGKNPDNVNVQRAIEFVRGPIFSRNALLGWDKRRANSVSDIIRVTMFKDGAFPFSPANLVQKSIRDADLMSIYTFEGRALLVGLYTELGINMLALDAGARWSALEKNATFLREATMFTKFGRQMQEFHLERALEDFRRELEEGRFHQ
jgi:hypothetical protein